MKHTFGGKLCLGLNECYNCLSLKSIISLYSQFITMQQMKKSTKAWRQSRKIEENKQNQEKKSNIPTCRFNVIRKPKLIANNKIMQKLFPNFHTLQHGRQKPQPSLQILLPKSKVQTAQQEKLFRMLFAKQKQKYQQLLMRNSILERPDNSEIRVFLNQRKTKTSSTHRS